MWMFLLKLAFAFLLGIPLAAVRHKRKAYWVLWVVVILVIEYVVWRRA